jgi:hypothetical protein
MLPKKDKLAIPQFLGLLCIFSVFLDKAIRGGGLPFDFYYYYPIFVIFLISIPLNHLPLALPPRWFNVGVLAIIVSGVVVTWLNGLLGFELLKQTFGILFTAITYYNVIRIFKFDVSRVFSYYLRFAYWVALFGVIDNILHIAGIHLTKVLIDGPYRYREFSIMGEPFYLALAITPAIVYYTCYFKRTWETAKFRYLILLICYLVTYSSTAVMGIGLAAFFALYMNDFFNLRRNRIIFAPLFLTPVVFLVFYLIENVNLINKRYKDTTSLFFSSEINVKEAGKSNSSTFALYSNYVIARDSFLDNPLFGSGLGSHPLIYEKTFLKYFPPNYLKGYGPQNQQDANSRFLRLMSETGLLGLVLFLASVVAFMAPKSKVNSPQSKELVAINYAVLVYIILGLIRNGNYINVGFFLFYFLYYFSWLQVKYPSYKTLSKVRTQSTGRRFEARRRLA